MSSNNETGGQNIDVDQVGDDETPLMVVHFRKATSAISLDNIGIPHERVATANDDPWLNSNLLSSWANDPNKNVNTVEQTARYNASSPVKVGNFSASPFRSVESPFKMVLSKDEKKFSATPGPLKRTPNGSGMGDGVGTPTRELGGKDPATPVQYNMFKSDDGWSNVRKVAGSLALSSPSQHSMSPLMNSMVDRVVDHNSPLPPRMGKTAQGDNRLRQERVGEMALVMGAAAVDADLDIRNVAKDLDASRFQGSLSCAGSFRQSQGALGGAEYSFDFQPRQRPPAQDTAPAQASTFNRTLFGADEFSYNLPQDPLQGYWQASNASGLGNSALLAGERSHMSSSSGNFASRSFPQFSAERVGGLDGTSNVGSILSGMSSLHNASSGAAGDYLPNVSSFAHNDSEFSSSGYSVQHSYPAYHHPVGTTGGMPPLPEPHFSGAHVEYGEYGEPLRQNWVDAQGYQASVSAHQQDLVEDFSQLSTQLSQEFMDLHQSNRNSGAVNTALRYAPQKPRAAFNASAPAFKPQVDTSRQSGKRLPPPHSNPTSSAVYTEKDSYGTDSAGGHFRPPQQTQYEPPLPNTNSIRVSGRQTRQTRSDGSFDPRGSGERSQRNSAEFQAGSRSGGNSLQSSIESDGSIFSSPQLSEEAGQDAGSSKASIQQFAKEVNKQSFLRVDIPESYEAKVAYKSFCREYKEKERLGAEEARKFAVDALQRVPEDCKWRIHLELADLAKKSNDIREARAYYLEVCRAQPTANTGWLEWSKMEEEIGDLRQALRIMNLGMRVCSAKEMLLTKAIKLQERLHGFDDVRGMLSTLRHESMDKVWKSILEGSLFEARAGNIPVSRRLFKYLINHVPWYGPIYFEAFRLEEKEGNDKGALAIILKGLKELPRYGPLWFGLFRIMERVDIEEEHRHWQRGVPPKLANLSKEAADAVRSISKELTWKVHFEKSQAEERAAEVAALGMNQNSSLSLQQCRDFMLGGARQSLVRSLMSCPGNLRWRVLLVGARMELGVGAVEKARFLLQRALQEVPGKSKSYVYLECSRVEEYLGNLDTARALLLQARQEVSREWKVFLEAVLVEARAGYVEKAAKVAREAVRQHSGTGRLWAMYIQLCHRLEVKYFNDAEKVMIDSKLGNAIESEEAKKTLEDIQNMKHPQSWLSKECVIRRAIAQVPKSGEVWCERARCQLNPLSVHCFDLCEAQRALSFATQFTPQYGDTFLEYVRLEMICQVLLPHVLTVLGVPVATFIAEYISADLESDLGELPPTHWAGLSAQVPDAVAESQTEQERRRSVILAIERMQYDAGDLIYQYRDVKIKNLNRRCINADPNYGSAWFHCRAQPHDVPSAVLKSAIDKLVHELTSTQAIYTRAVLHFVRRCLRSGSRQLPRAGSFGSEDSQVSSPARPRSAPRAGRKPVSGDMDGFRVSKSLNLPPGALSDQINTLDASVISNPPSSSTAAGVSGRSPSRDVGATDLREAEILEDIAEAEKSLRAWPKFNQVHLLPFVDIGGGTLFCCTDFVTGMIEMNRDMYNPHLSAEGRRKILFGSDQIVS